MKRMICGIGVSLVWLCGYAAAAQEFGPWSAPVNAGPVINSAFDDMHPTLSKDGLSLIFSSNRPGAGRLDLWVSQRDSLDSPWQTPQNLAMLNSPFDDHAANLTTDGHWVFFYSTRPDGCSAGQRSELWAAHRHHKRDDFGWDPPINLGCTLNVPGTDQGAPGFWEDDSTGTLYLYFARNYTPSDPNGLNIYVSTCLADLTSCNEQQLWSPPSYVAELSFPGFRNTKTGIRRRDGLEIIVTSNRPGSVGMLNLWVSTRASLQDSWSIPINLTQDNADKGGAAIVNSAVNDGAAALSWDGQTMMLYSNRAGGFGNTDLYVSTRTKVNGR